MTKHKKAPNTTELEQQIGELTQDLQRTRADFENIASALTPKNLTPRQRVLSKQFASSCL